MAYFCKKIDKTQIKYRAYDRELLAIYMVVKHFRHVIDGCHFTILTEHKPLVFIFRQSSGKASSRQLRHLDFIAQFSTDIIYITGKDSFVADLSI